MPELPEVETVKESLKSKILNKRVKNVVVNHNNIIEFPDVDKFKMDIINQNINDIKRRGKWLVFELDDYFLLSHLRMEGKFYHKKDSDVIEKHEHVIFQFTDKTELRYRDTRKFGKMHLILKENINKQKPLSELGLEPWDSKLTIEYLKAKFINKKLPIKTVILDQSIIVGIGNIYADEILFFSKVNPLKRSCDLSNAELKSIIHNTKEVLEKAIAQGGTTIRTYTSSEGVHGRFQQQLMVHNRLNEKCNICGSQIVKIKVNGRGTYYCPICQK